MKCNNIHALIHRQSYCVGKFYLTFQRPVSEIFRGCVGDYGALNMALPFSCSTLQLSEDFLENSTGYFPWLEIVLKLSQGHKLPKPSKNS